MSVGPTIGLWGLARERASKYAPMPKWEPLLGGLVGISVLGVFVSVLTAFVRLDLNNSPVAVGVTVITGFSIPYFVLRHKQGQHVRACSKEYEILRRERPGSS
jgi:hypothetical protein